MDEAKVKRYEDAIYQSLVGHPDPDAEIVKIRKNAVRGSAEWIVACEKAIARFEAR